MCTQINSNQSTHTYNPKNNVLSRWRWWLAAGATTTVVDGSRRHRGPTTTDERTSTWVSDMSWRLAGRSRGHIGGHGAQQGHDDGEGATEGEVTARGRERTKGQAHGDGRSSGAQVIKAQRVGSVCGMLARALASRCVVRAATLGRRRGRRQDCDRWRRVCRACERESKRVREGKGLRSFHLPLQFQRADSDSRRKSSYVRTLCT